jgi:hypothetical protein
MLSLLRAETVLMQWRGQRDATFACLKLNVGGALPEYCDVPNVGGAVVLPRKLVSVFVNR